MNAYILAIVGHLVTPSDLALAILTLGVAFLWFNRTRTAGRILSTAAVIIFLMVGFLPLAGWVTASLENRFPNAPTLPRHVDGLIVLGGAVDPTTTLARSVPTLNSEAERMTEFVRLAKHYPHAKLVFAGGGHSRSTPPTMSEADVARLFFWEQGLDTKHIVFEAKSQNTYENILFARSLVLPKPKEIWLLISSAQDVPRCIAVFKKFRWQVIPRSVAYKSDANNDLHLGRNMSALDRSAHEWIGLLFYKLTGKSDELFPRP